MFADLTIVLCVSNQRLRTFPDLSKKAMATATEQQHSMKREKTGDETWDEILATPESIALIMLMESSLEDDIAQGLLEEGGFGDAD